MHFQRLSAREKKCQLTHNSSPTSLFNEFMTILGCVIGVANGALLAGWIAVRAKG
jgi:hypothetical protein